MRRRRRVVVDRWLELATYNAERSRGIVHTPGWAAFMEREQARFDAEQEADLLARGYRREGDMWIGPA